MKKLVKSIIDYAIKRAFEEHRKGFVEPMPIENTIDYAIKRAFEEYRKGLVESTPATGYIDSISHSLYVDFITQTYPREAILPVGSYLYISGWAINNIDKCVFDAVHVIIDKTIYSAKRQKRTDVADVLGGDSAYIMSGYVLSMSVPFVVDGNEHEIKVVGETNDGRYYAIQDCAKFTVVDKDNAYFLSVHTLFKKYIVHPDDNILRFPFVHHDGLEKGIMNYLKSGNESANVLKELCKEIFPDRSKISLFEFASGYGCITRHLDNNYFDVTACDIHPEAMNFIDNSFGVKTMLSKSNPDEFCFKQTYDVVFALSFFSHMPDRTFGKWISTLYGLVKQGGALIFTTHGKLSNERTFHWTLDNDGYAFDSLSEQTDLSTSDYGTTVSEYSYVKKICEQYLSKAPTEFKEGFWWGHQDTYIIRKGYDNE